MTLHCFVAGHEALLRQKRDEAGRLVKPHVIVWECLYCHQVLGETALIPQWSLLARIRRQRARRAQAVA